MTHDEKIKWMGDFCAKHNLTLELNGECGFGRDCVGVTINENYPDYMWYDSDFNRIDNNGEVWCPDDAYHKHDCVAVLGRGQCAEEQLYLWLKWFDENNFYIETGKSDLKKIDFFDRLLGKDEYQRFVKGKTKDSI